MPKKNGPNAAIAAVQPITPPACRRSKIIGICLNVAAFPIPVNKKTASMPHRKRSNSASMATAPPLTSGESCMLV